MQFSLFAQLAALYLEVTSTRWGAGRVLASHYCSPSWIPRLGLTCSLSLSLILVLAPRVFFQVLLFFFLHKNQFSEFQFDLEAANKKSHPPSGMSMAKFILLLLLGWNLFLFKVLNSMTAKYSTRSVVSDVIYWSEWKRIKPQSDHQEKQRENSFLTMVLCLMKKEGNLEHVRKLAVQPVDQLAVQDLMKRELYLIRHVIGHVNNILNSWMKWFVYLTCKNLSNSLAHCRVSLALQARNTALRDWGSIPHRNSETFFSSLICSWSWGAVHFTYNYVNWQSHI